METQEKTINNINSLGLTDQDTSLVNALADDTSKADINYYINRIQDAINEYSAEHENESIYKLSKTRWNAVLIYIYNKVFKPIVIKREKSIIPYKDINLLNELADYYIYLCNEYNKDISVSGYCKLIGISYMTLKEWNIKKNRSVYYIDLDNNNYMVADNEIKTYQLTYPNHRLVQVPNSLHTEIIKKLTVEREQSLKSITLDGSIPALALGKIDFGWIEGGLQQRQAELLDNYTAPTELLDSYTRQGIPENKI